VAYGELHKCPMENSACRAYADRMTTYLPRVVDDALARALRTSGGLLVKGPRACGKTESARRLAQSEITLDSPSPEVALAVADPSLALPGPTPRLLDEWQAIPEIWNVVRHEIDNRHQRGQFILTGSATPPDDARRHPGAGRITSVTMRTMTLGERGVPSTPASLRSLFDGTLTNSTGTSASVSDYVNWMVSGGWPGWIDLDPIDALSNVRSYLSEMSEHDYPEIAGARRDPRRLTGFLTAYAGLIGQPASFAAIARRIGEVSGNEPSAALVPALHDFAARLFLIEDQPAWATKLRSRTSLMQTPKRHLADPSLALSLLGATPDRLLMDLETLGMAFESQAVHDVRVAADAMNARGVFHLRDTKGRDEIDVVVEAADGAWVGMEVKLSHRQLDAAAHNLLRVSEKVDRAPAALAVIIPTGPVARRPDGVWVIPLAALRP
jgi:predicted AAA+ superfamily ATPase